jgi:hypothetical protein
MVLQFLVIIFLDHFQIFQIQICVKLAPHPDLHMIRQIRKMFKILIPNVQSVALPLPKFQKILQLRSRIPFYASDHIISADFKKC